MVLRAAPNRSGALCARVMCARVSPSIVRSSAPMESVTGVPQVSTLSFRVAADGATVPRLAAWS
jgi:hypothetical protein